MTNVFDMKRRQMHLSMKEIAAAARDRRLEAYEENKLKIEDLYEEILSKFPMRIRDAMKDQIEDTAKGIFYDRPSNSIVNYLETLNRIHDHKVLENAIFDFLMDLPELKRTKKGKALYNTFKAYLNTAKRRFKSENISREDLGL